MKQQFRLLISETVSPPLRDSGFTRRGLNFERSVASYTQLLNVQRSRLSADESCSFTFNTGFYVPSVASIYFDEGRSPRHPNEAACVLRRRGGYVAGHTDLWFQLEPTGDILSVRAAVHDHVTLELLPYLNRVNSRESILEAMSVVPSDPQQQVFRAIFLAREVDRALGISAMKDLVHNATHPIYRGTLERVLQGLLRSEATS